MTTKAQKVRLGIFAVSTAALVAVVLIVFAGLRLWEGHDRYQIVFEESVLGLEEGAEVTFGGIKVGTVVSISLDPADANKIRVHIEVKEGLPVRGDTTATLSMAGITGLKVIDLKGGSASSPRLAAGATIPTGETTLSRLERQATQLVDQSQEIIGKANQVMTNLTELTEPSQYASISEFFEHALVASKNVELTTAELHAMVAENRATLRTSLASVERTAASIEHTATSMESTATSASLVLDKQVPAMVTNVNGLVDDMRGVIRTNGNHLGSAMFDLRQASRSFKELARDLRARPSRLLRSDPPAQRSLP